MICCGMSSSLVSIERALLPPVVTCLGNERERERTGAGFPLSPDSYGSGFIPSLSLVSVARTLAYYPSPMQAQIFWKKLETSKICNRIPKNTTTSCVCSFPPNSPLFDYYGILKLFLSPNTPQNNGAQIFFVRPFETTCSRPPLRFFFKGG